MTHPRIESLLDEFKALPITSQRSVAAIVGAAVADAATRPFHWVYNLQKLERIVGRKVINNIEHLDY